MFETFSVVCMDNVLSVHEDNWRFQMECVWVDLNLGDLLTWATPLFQLMPFHESPPILHPLCTLLCWQEITPSYSIPLPAVRLSPQPQMEKLQDYIYQCQNSVTQSWAHKGLVDALWTQKFTNHSLLSLQAQPLRGSKQTHSKIEIVMIQDSMAELQLGLVYHLQNKAREQWICPTQAFRWRLFRWGMSWKGSMSWRCIVNGLKHGWQLGWDREAVKQSQRYIAVHTIHCFSL